MSAERVDVLVVGGGTSGAAAARAFALQGRSVVLLDRREPGAGGARWVDSIPSWCFEAGGLSTPHGDELYTTDHGAAIIRPAGRGRAIRIEHTPMLHVEIPELVRRLSDEAVAAGARMRRGALVDLRVLAEHTHVELEHGPALAARLVVDASGLGGAVRRRVPALAAACPDPDARDLCTAAQWRYQVRDRDGAVRFLARYGAAPGDTLAFPSLAGGFSTLTFFTSRALDHIGLLTGTIPALGAPSAAALMDRFVTRAPWLGERLFGGQGAIPLRRPYATLARDRAALIGDAGCMVYASHGSGVGMGLIAARLLADASAGDADPGAPAALARYERSLHSRFGPLLSAADAFRRFSQGLSYEDVVAMFDAGLLDAALAGKALEQRPIELGPAQALRALTGALAAPSIALRFALPVARTLLLQAAMGHLPPPASARGRALWDRAVEALVGPPLAAAPSIVDVEG